MRDVEPKQSDLAYELGRYRFRIQSAREEPTADVGKYCLIHRRQANGAWMWAIEIFNSDLPCPERSQTRKPERPSGG